MASLDFYATREDLIDLLAHVFDLGIFRVFETYSRYDSELREFRAPAEVDSACALGTSDPVLLSLWAPCLSSAFFTERITLKPKYTGGATFRFAASGWGLMTLVLGGASPVRSVITASTLKHNSQARARAWESTYIHSLGPVAAWDWAQLESLSRKLRYHIRRHLSSGKAGARPVLSHAAGLMARGYTLQ